MSERIKKIMGIWEIVKEQGLESDEVFDSLGMFIDQRYKLEKSIEVAFMEYKDLVESKSQPIVQFTVNGHKFARVHDKVTFKLLDIAIKEKKKEYEDLVEIFKSLQ